MSSFLISFLSYAVYTLLACAGLSRLHWTRRSIVMGMGWLGWPTAALFGLVIPDVLSLIAWKNGGLSGAATPAFLFQVGVLHLLSALIIIRTTMGALGCNGKSASPAVWRLVLRLVLIPAVAPLAYLLGQFLPLPYRDGFWMTALLFFAMAYEPLAYSFAAGRGTFEELPPGPLATELLSTASQFSFQKTRVRLDIGPLEAGEGSDFGAFLARRIRWQHGLRTNCIPKEFLTSLPPESVTAAVSITIKGLDDGYNAWRRAALHTDTPRNIPSFFRALAEFDRFLLQPGDPAPLVEQYEDSWQLKLLARRFGTADEYAQAMAAVREVLGRTEKQFPADRDAGSPPSET